MSTEGNVQSPVREFEIRGLLGDRNIHLRFDDAVNILIADNGSGKTTVLGALYAVLSGQFARLRRLEFSEIVITFASGQVVNIPRSMLVSRWRSGPMRRLRHIPPTELERYASMISSMSIDEFRRSSIPLEIRRYAGPLSPMFLYQALRDYGSQLELLTGMDEDQPRRHTEQAIEAISAAFPYRTAYFPTYRRIEEEMENLGYSRSEGKGGEQLIQFGMGDVAERIKLVTEKIKTLSVEWFSKVNGQMLSQLVDGIEVEKDDYARLDDRIALQIVLDRIGSGISETHKSHIMEIVDNGNIRHPGNAILAYFISNLIQVYDHQRTLDNSIKQFVSVCNGYLVDKEIRYNEGRVELQVSQKRNDKPVDVSRLSSGEKQIISLFSRLYLEDEEKVAILFDEPELSLSVEWQRKLLPDMLRSNRCVFLVATTHSPFIFENELDVRARDLGQFIGWTS